MSTFWTALIIAGCLFAAVGAGLGLRRLLPEHHLSADTKDVIKLATGLVATMSALVLGLLLSSAKSSYDAERNQVIQMGAKVAFLDRVLALYGPEAAEARAAFRATVEDAVGRIWPGKDYRPVQLAPDLHGAEVVYGAIQRLAPQDDLQRTLKTQATTLTIELGQLRSLLVAQSVASISRTLLVVVVGWLVAIFVSFSVLAPPNATARLALLVSAFAVAGAFFLILELDCPFGGLIQISSEPIRNALNQLAK